MATKLIDPVVQHYLFHDSPLRTSKGKWSLGIISAVIAVLSVIGWRYFLHGHNMFEYLVWIPLSIVGSVIAYLLFAFLDRERRVRAFHFVTILSTLFVFTSICAFFNTISPIPRWTVGLVEEGFKGLPVLLLAIYVPNLIRTRKDGMVYGAMAGLGLNIIEIGSYIASALSKNTVTEALTMHLTRLGLGGIGSHIIWSAFVGMGIGMAMESSKTGWVKWRPAIICFLLAAAAHTGFDLHLSGIAIGVVMGLQGLFGANITESGPDAASRPGAVNNALRYSTYVYNLAFLIAEIINIWKSFGMENSWQVEELSLEEPTLVEKTDLELLQREKLFSKRKYAEYPKRVGAKIVLYQNLLAVQKHNDRERGRDADADEVVANLRRAIVLLRGQPEGSLARSAAPAAAGFRAEKQG